MKALKIFILTILVISIYRIIFSEYERHYGLDKGLNNTTNKILLMPEEALEAKNVYYDSKRVVKRPGFDIVATYSTSSENDNIFGLADYTVLGKAVMATPYWEVHFRNDASDGLVATANATVALYKTATNVSVDHDLSRFPKGTFSFPSGVETNYFDCVQMAGVLYCATAQTGGIPNPDLTPGYVKPVENVKFNAKASDNLIESFDTVGDWSCLTDCGSTSAQPGKRVEGTNIVGFDVTATTTTTVGMQNTGIDSLDLEGHKDGLIYIEFPGTNDSISPILVRFSTAGVGADYRQHSITHSGETGYYRIDLDTTTATSGSTDENDITEINIYVQRTNATDSLGTHYFDALTFLPEFHKMGVPAVTDTLSGATGAAGVLTGDYKYRFSCVHWDGSEGNCSAASATVTAASDKIDLTSMAECDGTYGPVRYKNIYRTKAGGSNYFYVAQIPNVDTTYTDNTADTSLGDFAPILGDSLNDNGVPPAVKYLEVFKNRIWGAGDEDQPSRLYFSEISGSGAEPESWRQVDFLDINKDDGQAITGLFASANSIFVFKSGSVWEVRGDNPNNHVVSLISTNRGTTSNRSLVEVDGIVYFIDKYGVYAFNQEEQFVEISAPIRESLFTDLDTTELKAFAEYYPKHRQIWFMLPADTTWGNDTLAIFHLDNGAWSSYTFEEESGCGTSSVTALNWSEEDENTSRMHIGTGAQGVFRYERDTSDTLLTSDASDGTCAIDASFQTKYFYQEQSQDGGPIKEKIYDHFYTLFEVEASGDAVVAWDFDYESAFSDSNTVTLTGNANQDVLYKKVFFEGSSGDNRSVSFRITDNSTTDVFTLLGLETHFKKIGGDR
jgi:hypothetical protein